jgi:hypothetical protein
LKEIVRNSKRAELRKAKEDAVRWGGGGRTTLIRTLGEDCGKIWKFEQVGCVEEISSGLGMQVCWDGALW